MIAPNDLIPLQSWVTLVIAAVSAAASLRAKKRAKQKAKRQDQLQAQQDAIDAARETTTSPRASLVQTQKTSNPPKATNYAPLFALGVVAFGVLLFRRNR